MLSEVVRNQILESTLEKHAGLIRGAASVVRGAFHSGVDATRGVANAVLGRSRTATGELISSRELKRRLATATGDDAVKLTRQRDAARFKQVAAGGLGLAGTYQAAKGADAHERYMRQVYGIRP